MIQFSKLRLHGFKSFVEKTELEIGPGLTGIVGPNGCGKSNLVEALRWNMGENSTKRMRGGSRSMEDVIFAGTANRPQRSSAEVSILLDNSKRTAPGPHNNVDEIEVSRKIERDHGSGYRINGKSVRARDVQLLYADLVSGANSPYLVSQGRVTQIIQAKPLDRRMILEEAAGITGLYARRHEAELRLRATDNNLKRVDDLVGSMEERLNNLKKQSRQASRYRNLSAQIRQLEISIACLEWREAYDKLSEIEKKFASVESVVADRLTVVTQLTRTQNVQSKDLPDLRQKDAELGAALQANNLALQRLEDEQSRLSQQRDEAKAQLEQIQIDRKHEQQTLEENTHVLERLDGEEKSIRAKEESGDTELQEKEATREALKTKVDELDTALTALMESTADARARRHSLERQVEQDTQRQDQLKQRLADVKEQLEAKKADNSESVDTKKLREMIEGLEQKAQSEKEAFDALEEQIDVLRAKREDLRQVQQEQEKDKSKLETEINTLESILNSDSQYEFKPVFEDIEAEKGFETALSRALGDSLMASTDDSAPAVWQKREFDLSALPALPDGVMVLEPHIKAPQPLKLALSQIGFVESEEDGMRLSKELKPGQALVSREGAYWRWDGLYIKTTASDSHAQQLKQKNKLAELKKDLPKLEKQCEDGRKTLEQSEAKLAETRQKLDASQQKLSEMQAEIKGQQAALNNAIEQQAEKQAELAKLEEALSMVEADLVSLAAMLAENIKTLEAFDEKALEEQQAQIETNRSALSAEREKLQEAIKDLEIARQDQSRRQARIRAIGDERVNLQNRCIRARERLKELDEREEQLTQKLEELKQRPAVIKKDMEGLLSKIGALEAEKGGISDRLASCENELGETTKALKEAESELAQARESRAHAQATAEERKQRMDASRRYIQEHFEMGPEELMAEAAMDPENLPALDNLKEEREKAIRSRDLIGPVNLRAEQEAEDLEKELGGILNEKNDLVEAVNELRQGINKLNKEARERLQLAFEQVNNHFRDIFTRLFNGGQAHLALIESDDPLEAGLEIFAQPPGKALQSLSLLSGGEQTMTAVALIFAMFMTTPAPICVLDEVDAPLDDANVDRFCDLLEEFAEKGQTRFLVITHHRLTMARMDRLYGVTMAERGVSKLVSVDLHQQLDFLDDAA
ncbi:MAG: chromosome segregation protein SMC [Rhodospirillales bacterium]|nr:chromosome segregation protein SMC [Rhodospirillales bacterium]